jgi:DNA polymerase-3 subunit delta'
MVSWNKPHLYGCDSHRDWIDRCLEKGNLPHGLLFQGSQGVGKTSFALECAARLLGGGWCRDAQDPLWRRMASQGHGDFFILESLDEFDQKDITIDQIRQMILWSHQTPLEGGWRVAIIHHMGLLKIGGANGLLKLLEEPPRAMALILIDHGEKALLPTLRSRCIQRRFLQLSEDAMNDLNIPHDSLLRLWLKGRPGSWSLLEKYGGIDFFKKICSLRQKGSDVISFTNEFFKGDFGPVFNLSSDIFLWAWYQDIIKEPHNKNAEKWLDISRWPQRVHSQYLDPQSVFLKIILESWS